MEQVIKNIKPNETVLYSKTVVETARHRYSTVLSFLIALHFFLLPLFIIIPRRGIILWITLFLVYVFSIFVKLPQKIQYVLTDEALYKLRHPSFLLLWKISINHLLQVRRIKNSIQITIPKKRYIVYNYDKQQALFQQLIRLKNRNN